MIRLGVNIDHVATLREVRKAKFPSLVEAAEAVKRAGAHQITIHLREDRRHIQDRDLRDLMKWGGLPINLEMAMTSEMMAIALRMKPACITLVPEKRREMTTESGLDLSRWCGSRFNKNCADLQRLKGATQISAFIDTDLKQVRYAEALGFQAIEFHTGHYAELFENKKSLACDREIQRLDAAASLAHRGGLEVRAGHGLNLKNIGPIKRISHLAEVNIGHAIVCDAVFVGLEEATRQMLRSL